MDIKSHPSLLVMSTTFGVRRMHASRANSHIVGRNLSMAISFIANKDLTPMLYFTVCFECFC